MKGKFARILAIAVAGSVLAVSGAGVASADGKGTSSTEAAGQQVLQLRDQLTKSAYAADVPGTQRSLDQLSPVLGDLAAGQKYSIQADAQQQAADANGLSTEGSRILADPAQAQTARQLPPVPSLPDLPAPLDMVGNLVKNLLVTVTSLLLSLLPGGVPALPVPALPVPAAPVPGV
ncbi:hypothetical protein LWP59_36745 [Amycolatopsis acidiphila]|uniref:Secreted protein n=1 Tax=Amycolatopsis acidiphila TaxID=715473 RepID=A0A557ZTR2_9PSEU|nr:hypothetical protein [Amycolatopsis acidiphila]TVT15414.1 hypothetical protein FNH06_36255 [Amycolatopsis acidiphila]UIJ59517.1 hypothetical protein LWP59_36745 [Amycolatopsis acidiphila]GHG80371.1 hypothetical protein GCM10017788_49300 [Amycolatopsis acidiphila]